jgi:hypothetical protein
MVSPIGAVVAAIGIGVTAVGASQASSAAKQAAQAQAKGAKKQAKLTAKQNKQFKEIAQEQAKAAKVAADIQTAAGKEANALRDQVVASINTTRQQMVDAQNQQAAASVSAETARFQQMTLDAIRARRQVIRQALITRSTALVGATAQGAQGGSGLAGGIAQISNQRSQMLTGIFQNTDIGNAIFEANRAFTEAGALVNQFQASIESQSSLGESQLADIAATAQGALSQAEASTASKQAKLANKATDISTRQARVQSQTNIAVGKANTKLTTAQGIEAIGSSLTQAGTALL